MKLLLAIEIELAGKDLYWFSLLSYKNCILNSVAMQQMGRHIDDNTGVPVSGSMLHQKETGTVVVRSCAILASLFVSSPPETSKLPVRHSDRTDVIVYEYR